MITALTIVYLVAFQLCAWPAIVRLRRRRQSADLSVWREWLLLTGVACQWIVMLQTGADWRVWLSPVMSFTSVSLLLAHVYWYRPCGSGGSDDHH